MSKTLLSVQFSASSPENLAIEPPPPRKNHESYALARIFWESKRGVEKYNGHPWSVYRASIVNSLSKNFGKFRYFS